MNDISMKIDPIGVKALRVRRLEPNKGCIEMPCSKSEYWIYPTTIAWSLTRIIGSKTNTWCGITIKCYIFLGHTVASAVQSKLSK